MRDILVKLFAVTESGYWGLEEVNGWATEVAEIFDSPNVWILELSIATSISEVIDLIAKELKSSGRRLPEDFGSMLVGFISLKYKQGASSEVVMSLLIESVDAYPVNGLDVESVGLVSLDLPVMQDNLDEADYILSYLSKMEFTEEDRKLVVG